MSVVTVEQRIGVLRSSDSALTGEERAYFAALGQGAMLVMPLAFKGNTVGLVQLFDLDPQRDFMPRDLALAHTLATQAAIALENARLVQDLQRSLAELRAMQSHLVHAARLSALGELSAVVAHQINNPLTTILGDAEMLVQDIPTDDPKHASAEAIRRAGQRAKSVVARILTMSRMEYEPVRLDVNRTIEETLALVMPQIVQLPIVMDVSLSPGLPAVEAIPGQLEDVWMNLVMNGRDAIVDGGVEDGRIGVSSTLAPDRKQIVVTISDNGRGIPEEHLSRVFEPLFTTKPRGQGTGLGLYIVRQILTEHGGDIIIDSSPGRGTRVTVILPVASHSDEEGRWRIS
jgi:signal transduction histidine kinase